MFTHYLVRRTCGAFGSRLYSTASTSGRKVSLSEGQAALNHIDDLCRKGQFEEALKRVIEVEEKYPGCAKAVKHYRGEAMYGILKERGVLKRLGPTI